MKRLFDQHFLSHLLSLLALALLMPMGAWGQTLVFGEWNEFQGFVEKSAETVNWSDRVYTLPQLSIKNGDEYEETGTATYSSSNESVATVDENGTVTFVAYEGTVTITATCTNQNAAEGGPASSLTATFAITINDDRAEFGGMGVQFSESSATATYDQSFNPPTVSTGQFKKLALAYSSSSTNVATVDENSGDVTVVGVGETTISAAYAGDDYVKPGSISYKLTVNPATVTVSDITVSNKEYDGTTTATLNYSSATIQDAAGVSVSDVSVSSATGTFADANVGTDKTVTISGITLSSANYTVASTVTQASATADITARAAVLSWSNLTFTYDGQTHVPTATVSNLVSGDACTVTVTGGASEVGTHTATATALSNTNYSLPTTATQSFTISAATMADVSATGFTGTYDGKAHGITVTAPEGATVKYGTAEGTYTLAASPTYTDAGTYTVYYQVTKANYTAVTGSATVSISKAAGSISFATASVSKTFGDAAFTNALTKTGDGTVAYSSSDTQVATVNATSGEVSIVGNGSATITATVTDGTNYTYATKTASYTVAVGTAAMSVTASGFTGTYDGKAHGITMTAPEGATVKYGTAEGTYTLDASPTYTDAGTYTVYYQVTKANYTAVTGSATVSISKAAGSISFATVSVSKTFGDAAFTNALTKTGDGTVAYSSSDTQVATVNATSGEVSIVGNGSATITATVTGGTNYTYATKTASYTVAVGTAAMSVTASGFTGTYDGKAHGITVTAPEGATVKYGTAEGTYTLDASPTYTDAGTYTVYYQVTKANYTAVTGSATVSISKAAGSISFATASVSKTFGDAAFTNALTKTGDGTVAYSSSDTQVATVNASSGEVSIVGNGSATITATVTDGTNYTYATKTASYTVAVGTAAMSVTASGFTGTYDGTAHGITVTAPEGATVKYGTAEGTYTLDASPTYTDAGTYTVYYQVTKANYTAVTGSATVSISKATGWVVFSNGGTTITATIGEPFTPPTVSVTPNNATLHYTSSNPSVATVDDYTGEVTLLKAGTTTITARFEGDNNYTSDYHFYNLTVVEQDLVIEPITKEVDYTMDGTDFLNADGTEKNLSNAVVNNILYTLKDQDSPEGDGYDPDLQSIVLNTEKSTAAVEKLIADGVEPGTKEFAQNFTGITFLVPAGEGYIIITSQELNGANLMAKVGSNAPVAISMPQMGDYNIPYLSDHETWVYLWNGGQGGIESSRTRGRKTVANIRVQNVAYKARSNAPDGILSVDVDDDDTDVRWYNLRGQRIEKPKTKGLYIRNGQKVVVR